MAEDGYDKQLEAIRAEADAAYKNQNSAAWSDSCQRLLKVSERLESVLEEGGPAAPPPDPNQLLISLSQQLAALEKFAKQKKRYESFQEDFQKAAAALKNIDPKAPDAMSQIRDWYFIRFSDLQQRLEAPETIGIPGWRGQKGKPSHV